MQNFIAVAMFAALLGIVFFPDEIFRNENTQSPFPSRTVIHSKESKAGTEAGMQSGTGFLMHYIGVEERRD